MIERVFFEKPLMNINPDCPVLLRIVAKTKRMKNLLYINSKRRKNFRASYLPPSGRSVQS